MSGVPEGWRLELGSAGMCDVYICEYGHELVAYVWKPKRLGGPPTDYLWSVELVDAVDPANAWLDRGQAPLEECFVPADAAAELLGYK